MDHALRIRPNQPRFFKVPESQRRANSEAYNPSMFSFGPYRAGDARLRDGEHFKRLVAAEVLPENGLQSLVDRIKTNDAHLRDMYIQMSELRCHTIRDGHVCAESGDGHVCVEALAKVLAIDSTFIIATLSVLQPVASFIRDMVNQDAMQLDNQIPIFLLKYALDILPLNNPATMRVQLRSVLESFASRFNPFKSFQPIPEPGAHIDESAPLLGYVYDYLTRPGGPAAQIIQGEIEHRSVLSTASRLARCGLRFRPCTSSFRGVEFRESTVELLLPAITVVDSTPRFLHNLLAYEATSRAEPHPVLSYVYLMDCLIDTEEDVQILVEARVILNHLGSNEELACSWNRLGTNVVGSITPANKETMTRVERLTKKRVRKWRAALIEKYWEKQPWLLFSVMAATILLGLTILQSVYTINDSGSSG